VNAADCTPPSVTPDTICGEVPELSNVTGCGPVISPTVPCPKSTSVGLRTTGGCGDPSSVAVCGVSCALSGTDRLAV
jgi:hypothetical protein